ncbi:MAG TPA: hypothetical protein VNM68_14700 [Candidatus Polarisedimenticolia bacterium]|nr:hypothetical protein [Candidatus Polarisedimenticolia bacterium]
MAIDSNRGVNESGYVRIGGLDQWVQIRGPEPTGSSRRRDFRRP